MNLTRGSSAATIIFNVRVITPDAVLPDASLVIEQGIIRDIADRPVTANGFTRLDGCGHLLLPGFIDIHSDVIENAIQPRPGGRFPVDVALHELDKQLVACGVTSIFHCLCFLDGSEDPPFRNARTTIELINQIEGMKDEFRARTHVHARYEMTNEDDIEQVKDLLGRGLIHLFSLMDHTPGQGQFSEVANFRAYYAKARGLSGERVDRIIERRLAASSRIDWEALCRLARACRDNGVAIASHDDDCNDKVEVMQGLGVTLSEFPVNREAALAARRHGMLISLGSPNILRGASLTGNLSGCEAIGSGLGDILCSDYAPMSLLHAALKLFKEGILDLPSAVRLISLNAARATGIEAHTGSITDGKAADLVLVDDSRRVAQVVRTFVSGRQVFSRGD